MAKRSGGLTKWFEQDWVDIGAPKKGGGFAKCGRSKQKKDAKRKARIEQRRAKRSINNSKESEKTLMHDIDKPITLEDLTNPDKN